MSGYEAVIGIETHVELQTQSKMFCGCKVDFGAEPNTNVCPVCLGLPGALPVPNEAAIDGILQIGAAVNCAVATESVFHRKNYFYPDLPKNYQISQYDIPICVDGHVEVAVDGETVRVGITRVHMEEDTGKSLHQGDAGRIHDADHSLLDFNRAGVPLVEIVTEPDFRTPEQARAYGTQLQQIIRALGISDAKLEEGRMRFDANISVRKEGTAEFGTRAEVKNVNSLRSLQRAIVYEIDRQIELLESGGEVVQETRHWNEDTGRTTPMRSKEDSEDYRYFQEPDLVPLHIGPEWQERIRTSLPELPATRRERYLEAGVDEVTASSLVADEDLGRLFDQAVAGGADAKTAGNWLTGEVVAYLRREDLPVADTPLTGDHIVELHRMLDEGKVSATAAKEVLAGVLGGEGTPESVAEARDLVQVSDAGIIEAEVDAAIAANPDAFERLQAGDGKPLGFLVGQVMKSTGGKADPRMVSDLLRKKAGA